MDREIKKRSASDQPQSADQSKKRKTDPYLVDETEVFFKISSSPSAFEMMSIFEFPWQKAEGRQMAIEGDHGCDLRDVFFSSLVDGCRAAIGFPGDRLSRSACSDRARR
ncbi:uncharacterized protein A4U43_C01F5110 [Asparagus officinalis]|uniref:Uncharacterized protein n=1 Tax=Asparagus officinalis TaxID=4686 RepID=A0A5P1FMM0_ASPOF|nr:uncharacterized protein A4U43_C01F5110 [Asparagus officinalis]